jgi:ribosome-binding factor A
MPSGVRLQRVADRIRQELSEMLIREISDPRLGLIYVTDVKVDKELAYADVFVSVFPRLRFHWDPTPENADHIEKVLAELRAKKRE